MSRDLGNHVLERVCHLFNRIVVPTALCVLFSCQATTFGNEDKSETQDKVVVRNSEPWPSV